MLRALPVLFLLVACSTDTPLTQPEDLSTGTLAYNLQGPALKIEEPALGAFVKRASGDKVHVRGTSRAKAVYIEDQRIAVENGRFEGDVIAVPGMNVIHASAQGITGVAGERAFIYGDFTGKGASNPSAVVTRLNWPAFKDEDGQLNDISSIVTYTLSRIDLFEQLQQPFVFRFDFFLGSLDMEVLRVTYDGPSSHATIEPREGGAFAYGHLGKLALDLGLTLHFLGTWEATGHIDVRDTDFAGDVVANLSGGVIGASLENLGVGLDEVLVTTTLPASSVLDEIVTWIANTAKQEVSAAIAHEIEVNAANYFAVALSSLALPPTFDLSSYGVAAQIDTTYRLDGASFDKDGVTLSAAPGLSWPAGKGTALAEASPGSLRLAPSGMPAMPTDATIALSLSFDLINQALYSVWGQGALDLTVWNGGKKWGVTFEPVKVTNALPPVLAPNPDGTIGLSLGDVQAHTRVSVLGFGGDVDVNVSLQAGAIVQIAPEGDRLVISPVGIPTVAVDINSLLGIVPDIVVTAMERLVEWLAPEIASTIVQAVAIPLPTLPLDSVEGFEGHSLALAPPGQVTVDPDLARILVSASFVLRTPN